MSCFDMEKLFKKKPLIVLILLAIATFAIVSYSTTIPAAIYAYTKSVPIQVGYNEAQNYWLLSAVVDETTAFKMVLDAETTDSVDSDTQAKTKSEVGILVEPLLPYSTTTMDPVTKGYEAYFPANTEQPPAFDINDAGWLTTASYKLGVWRNGAELTSQSIKVNYQEQKVIDLDTPQGKVTVNNLGILPQGVEVPSGDLVLVYDPDGNTHIFNKADFYAMIDAWNNHVVVLIATATWRDVWNFAEGRGALPKDVQLVHISDIDISNEHEKITLTYGGIAFAGMITIYVPAKLADTIIIQLFNPIPEIISVEPDPLPKINEGESTVFYVKVKNSGTEGTVSIAVSSISYSFMPLTETAKNMEADEIFTFKFEAYALNVAEDKITTTKIFAQGRGGTDTYELKGEITNVEDYTPIIPEPTKTTLIIFVVDGNYKPIPEITVSITYGASTDTDLTNVDGTANFELGEYTGDVKILTQETATYPSKTEIIKVERGTNEHTMVLSGVFPWWILGVLAISIFVMITTLMVIRKRKRGKWF